MRDPNATSDQTIHPTSSTSTSHQSNSSHMAQHILSLIWVFLLYISSFHLQNCFISWGLVSDTILIKFIFSLPCNLFWCITANHSQGEITAGCSKYCCDDPLRHEFPVVHRNPYSFCSQRQYYSSGKTNKKTSQQRKPEISMIPQLPVFPGCLIWQLWMYSLAVVLTGLGWGRSRCPSQKPWGVFSHSPTSMTVSMCLDHQSDRHAKLFLQQVMDIIPGYACLVYVKSSRSFAGLVGSDINATFISCLQQMKFRLFWLKNLTFPLPTYTTQIHWSEFL